MKQQDKLTPITSQAQYERYLELRRSCQSQLTSKATLMYNALTVFIVNWNIKQEPGLVNDESRTTPKATKRLKKQSR